jgi:carbon-monoxide dehydrogenase medium subunit
MKPAPFEYSRPANLDEACAMLAAEEDVRVIAGGQTLVPLMAMRLARPRRLVDIARIPELTFVRREADAVAVGAATKQCILERDPLIRADVPLLAKMMPFVGHAPIRARGTLGGSLANADPAAEITLAVVILDATIVYREGVQTFAIPASDFFTGPMMTALSPSSCLTSVRFPVWPEARIGVGFHEVSARRSDFAFASAAAQIALDNNGVCRRAALGIGAVTGVPLRLEALARAIEGWDGSALDGGGKQVELRDLVNGALAELEPLSDLHASAGYRRRAAMRLLLRAISDAWRAAKERAPRAH